MCAATCACAAVLRQGGIALACLPAPLLSLGVLVVAVWAQHVARHKIDNQPPASFPHIQTKAKKRQKEAGAGNGSFRVHTSGRLGVLCCAVRACRCGVDSDSRPTWRHIVLMWLCACMWCACAHARRCRCDASAAGVTPCVWCCREPRAHREGESAVVGACRQDPAPVRATRRVCVSCRLRVCVCVSTCGTCLFGACACVRACVSSVCRVGRCGKNRVVSCCDVS